MITLRRLEDWLDWLENHPGYKDAAHIEKDKDLDALRDREEFKKLLAEQEAAAKSDGK
jgi:hypothetical protein